MSIYSQITSIKTTLEENPELVNQIRTIDSVFIQHYLDKTKTKLLSQKLRHMPKETQQDIIDMVPEANSLTEALYLIHYNTTVPVCYCGTQTKFKTFAGGYHEFCSAKCSANHPKTKSTREATCQTKYGVSCISQVKSINEKRIENHFAVYGVAYPTQRKEVIETRRQNNIIKYGVSSPNSTNEVKDKTRSTNIIRYGGPSPLSDPIINQTVQNTKQVDWLPMKLLSLQAIVLPKFNLIDYSGVDEKYLWECSVCSTEFKSNLSDGKIPKCPTCYPYIPSKPEQEVADFITSLGLTVDRNNKKILLRPNKHPLELDIVIESHKMAIEFDGIYTHAGKEKDYHLNKTLMAKQAGYRLIHVFEDEWTDKRQIVESRLRSIFKLNQKIHARKLTVAELNPKIAMAFFEANHLQGSVNHKICLGLFSEDGILQAAMSFGKARFNKHHRWELLRYASIGNVIGGASKLFTNFVRTHLAEDESVISYCDLRYGIGEMYRKLNFVELPPSKPNYYYVKKGVRFSRMEFQKHKLANKLEQFDAALSEEANMIMNGYQRIYDCGNGIFVYNKKKEG